MGVHTDWSARGYLVLKMAVAVLVGAVVARSIAEVAHDLHGAVLSGAVLAVAWWATKNGHI